MSKWSLQFTIDPFPNLMVSDEPSLSYFVNRDLLCKDPGPIDRLWQLPEAIRLVGEQQKDGSWKYPKRGKHANPSENYNLLQTYRNLRILIEQYGFNDNHLSIRSAAEYLFSYQSVDGDIRGIFGSQYAPHYSAGMLELLVKAGYQNDPRLLNGYTWFLDQRQSDGGWAWPLRTANVSYYEAIERSNPIESDRSQPFSHALTGFILRAFAAHPAFRATPDAYQAGILLKSRFFEPDKYSDRRAASYWTKFQYPFWWANLLTSLDSLSWIGFDRYDRDVQRGLAWLVNNQGADGLWETGYKKSANTENQKHWIGLAVCRVFKRFFPD